MVQKYVVHGRFLWGSFLVDECLRFEIEFLNVQSSKIGAAKSGRDVNSDNHNSSSCSTTMTTTTAFSLILLIRSRALDISKKEALGKVSRLSSL